LALFGRKKPGEEGAGENGDGKQPEPIAFSPEKAQRFFEHAKIAAETGRHEYAMGLWLGGLKLDPSSMQGLESFLKSAVNFDGKPGKELLQAVEGKGAADRYTQALLAWGLKIGDPALAVKAVQAAAKLDLGEQAYFIGEQALKLVASKPKKDLFVKLMEAFAEVQAFDLAVQAGDAAVRMDPSDGPLATSVKNMSAQQTMSKGGFDQAGKEGGFRANVRDLDKQRQLDEGERIVKTEATIDRLLADAEAAHLNRPDDVPTIQNLAKRLLERGRPEDEQRAIRLLMQAFETTKQYRFRQDAGKIKLRQLRRSLNTYKDAAEAKPDDEALRAKYAEAKAKFFNIEVAELKASVDAYPTDMSLKFELGKRYAEARDFDQAIALLQEAKGDARFRSPAMALLANAFAAMGWHDEAIATYRQALENVSTLTEDLRLELRYGLMNSLASKADTERDLSAAEEAEKLASSIAIEQFGYRDIREFRERLKKLVLELKQG
jgi:hypothetical protein